MARRLIVTLIFTLILLSISVAVDNLGVKSADAENNTPVSSAQIVDPAITIRKRPSTQTVVDGDQAAFDIEVENTGDVPLKNIVVTDPESTDCEETIPSLDPGVVHPISCIQPNVTTNFTNEAFVTAEHDFGDPVKDDDSADVQVINPGISISKKPDTQTIASGKKAEFSIEVENTGDVPLKNIVVTDPASADCEETIPSLDPGAVHPIDCAQPSVTVDFTNKATVNAEDALGNPVMAEASADVIIAKPGISITKKPDSQTILKGDSANFTIEVKNTGNVPLNNISVTDPNSLDCAESIPSLNPGGVHPINCAQPNVAADFTNDAFVTANHGYGDPVEANDSADVKVVDPGVSIIKTAKSSPIIKGGTAKFTIVVKNIGDVTLKNVVVSDPNSPDCAETIQSLTPDAIHNISCTSPSLTAKTFTNEAFVVAKDNFGHTVTDDDSAVVQVINPDISISKNPSSQTIAKGGTAKFTIEVKNTGDVTLYDVKVKDDRAPDCRETYTSLSPGAKKTISCEKKNVDSDFNNIAVVVARDNFDNIVTDDDDAWVEVENPNIQIIKTPSTRTITKGGRADFRIYVINTSKYVDLVNVKVEDPRVRNCDKDVGSLDREQRYEYTCFIDGVTESFTNEIWVTGNNSNNQDEVNDTSIAFVEILDMQVAMEIDPAILTTPGVSAFFSVMVENEGSVPFRLQSLEVDSLGSLIDPNNSKLEDNRCLDADDHLVEPGEKFTCSFSTASEEEPGIYTYELTVSARDGENTLVQGTASPSLIVADSELLFVSLLADPASLPAPGASITETIEIENLAPASTFTLEKLIHSELGSLDGDCSLPQSIEPEDNYKCDINIDVTGAIGDHFYHEVSAAGSTDDGKTGGGIDQTMISLFDEKRQNNWLPVISNPEENPEEPNNKPCDAHPIFPDSNYKFTLNDVEDWYQFDVRRSGMVTVLIENLVSRDAQVITYKNDDCLYLTDADRGPYDTTENSSRKLEFPANTGHYFIRVTADDHSSGATYTLKVLTP